VYAVETITGGTTGTTGGGGTPVITSAHSYDIVQAGSTATLVVPSNVIQAGLAVSEVGVTVGATTTNLEIRATKVTNLSSGVTPITTVMTGDLYQYVEIKTTNLANENIKSAYVKFQVNKSWLAAQGASADAVALYRWTTKWDKLETTKLSEDSNYVYYKAITPGFSIFAVFATEVITGVCTPNAKRCSDSSLQKCNAEGTGWITLETCSYGCNATTLTCNPAPEHPPAGPQCPTCPSPGAWSACVNGTQSRINYRCSAQTNYACEAYTETQSCAEIPQVLFWIVAGVVVVIIIAVVVRLLLMKKPKGYHYHYKK
jgi:PGF-pre-PGF domain-containing protein